MNTRTWLTVVVSAGAAAAVWALSPLLDGHREPWDTDGPSYVIALAVAGALTGVLVPRPLWARYLGAVVGQGGYALLFLPGQLTIFGAAFFLGYSLIFLAAAALASLFRTRFGSRFAKR